jgi:phage tail-like protein
MRKQLFVGGLSAGALVSSLMLDTGDMSAPTRRRDIDHVGMYDIVMEIDGVTVGKFDSVSGLSTEVRAVEGTPPDAPAGAVVLKRAGASTAGNVTLGGGDVASKDMKDWWDLARTGAIDSTTGEPTYKRDVDIVVYDNQGNKLRCWGLSGCWPSKWKFADLDGKGGDVTAEEIEFVVEEMHVK